MPAMKCSTPGLRVLTGSLQKSMAASMPTAPASDTLPHGIQADEIRASKMISSAVYDVQNRKIGSVGRRDPQ